MRVRVIARMRVRMIARMGVCEGGDDCKGESEGESLGEGERQAIVMATVM